MDYTFQDIKRWGVDVVKGIAVTGVCWVMCMMGFSYSWTVLAVVAFSYRQLYVSKRKTRIAADQIMYNREQDIINARLSELPNWVFFPDVEKAEWINMILVSIWPSVKEYCKTWMLRTLQPLVASCLPSQFASFRFLTIYLGELPPRIGGIKVYDKLPKKSEIVMDIDIYYAGNARVDVSVGAAAAGIEDLQLRGTLRVVLKPLLDELPFAGGLIIFFLQPPKIDYNLTQLGTLLDLPLLHGVVKSTILNVVAKRMVAPHKMTFVLSGKTDSMKLRQTIPDGVVRLEVVRAKNLAAKDRFIGKHGLSDPYVRISCGPFSGKTRTIDNTLEPQWHETFEFLVDQKYGEAITFDLFDEDIGRKHDPLGNVTLSVEDLASRGFIDDWLTLENAPGSIHVTATWYTLTSNLNEVMKNQESSSEGKLEMCVLCVFVDSARNLQIREKLGGGKKAAGATVAVQVIVGNDKRSTAPSYDMVNPHWHENFSFLVHRPTLEDVKFCILDSRARDRYDLGTLVVPLKDLLCAPFMATSGSHLLRDQGGQSELVLRLAVKALRPPSLPSPEQQSTPGTPGTSAGFPDSADLTVPPKISARSQSRTSMRSSNLTPSFTVDGINSGLAEENLDSPQLAQHQSHFGTVSTSQALDTASLTSETASNGLRRNDTLRMSDLRRRATKQPDHDTAIGEDVGLGKVQLTIRYSLPRSRLVIVVHSCTGLAPQGPESALNIYVSMSLLHEHFARGVQPDKKKTQIIKNSISPTFDEQLEFAINRKDVDNSSVTIRIRNKVSTFTKLNLGRLQIKLSELDINQPSTRWYNLQP